MESRMEPTPLQNLRQHTESNTIQETLTVPLSDSTFSCVIRPDKDLRNDCCCLPCNWRLHHRIQALLGHNNTLTSTLLALFANNLTRPINPWDIHWRVDELTLKAEAFLEYHFSCKRLAIWMTSLSPPIRSLLMNTHSKL